MLSKKIDYSKLTSLEKLYFRLLWLAEGLMNGVVSTLASTDDVFIRQGCDRQGNLVFYVSDRTTGQHYVFFSEIDLRIWIDQRHYRKASSPNFDQSYYRQRWLR